MAVPDGLSPEVTATPERISALANTLRERITGSIEEIAEINLQARVLSINAQIEASRAGEAGRAFSVVGQEMVSFSDRTQKAAQKLEEKSVSLVVELAEISRQLATNVRGVRLCDLALTNIDLIDRNLYERSCDCRWWATDAAFVAAFEQAGEETIRLASQRLGVILKAYTVYFDIVLADLNGHIIANGRQSAYPSVGTAHGNDPWFTSALATKSGNDFGFQSVHASTLAAGQRVLIYSCKVGEGGTAHARPIGVIGVVFNWDGLAQKIMHDTPIEADKQAVTRVCIVDHEGAVLADSSDRSAPEQIRFAERAKIFSQKKGSALVKIAALNCLVAHAQSPGFETYRSGWHSLIIEQIRL